MGDEKHSAGNLRDMGLVLLGRKWSGKTFSGNTILGSEHFQLSETIANRVGVGVVADRWRVRLVLTPGWWKPLLPNETMELVKLRMTQAVAQSGPAGPHAMLLIVDMDTEFDEKSAMAAEQHLELLGPEEVWRHTVVLLNSGIWHEGDLKASEYMGRNSRYLDRIVRKCGGRYHLLNTDRSHPQQVLGLLEKVERLVGDNAGKVFRIDGALARSAETRLRELTERVVARRNAVATERDMLRDLYEDYRLSEVRLLLMGWALSGRTTLADAILNGPLQDHGQKRSTAVSAARRGQVGRWTVKVVDTPGWWRFGSLEDTPEHVKQELLSGALLAGPPGAHAVVLVVCACIAFTEAHLRAIQEHMAFLGRDVWRHAVVVFNWCDALGDTTLEEFIESEGRPLQWLLRRCRNRYLAFSSVGPDVRRQVADLLEMVEWTVAGNSVLQVRTAEEEVQEEEAWQGEGVVIETLPRGVPLVELITQVCRKREEEFLESIRRIVVGPRKASSIGTPPYMSLHEMEENAKMVSNWLKTCHSEDHDHEDLLPQLVS